jgi:5'-nucleotidase / UDP-sugar diphosphatase
MKKNIIALTITLFSQLLYAQDLVILHTNDLHSMFEGTGPDALYTPEPDGDPVKGHFARLATLIEEERKKAQENKSSVLLVDAGDFYGGTLYQILGPDPDHPLSPEVDFLLQMKYDLVTLGNHEFDAGEQGLVTMLQKRQSHIQRHNLFTSTNIVIPKEHPLHSFVTPRRIIETAHGTIGLLSILGPDGARISAPLRNDTQFVGFNDSKMKVEWSPLLDLLKKEVAELKEKHGARFVVIVMHAGHPEDLKIAKEVPGIDVIISGHTHQAYETVLQVNDTWISQSGCYAQNLGKLEFEIKDNKLQLLNQGSHLLPIDGRVRANSLWDRRIMQYRANVDQKILRDNPYDGYNSSSHIISIDEPRERGDDWSLEVTSILKEQFEIETSQELAFYFTSKALIRSGIEAPIKNTPIQLSDLFRVLSLSTEQDKLYGAQTSWFYFDKSDTRKLIRFLFFYRRLSRAFNPSFSDDITYDVPTIRIPYFREVINLKWRGKSYSDWPKLMPIATNSIVANYFPKIDSMTKGLLSFTPRDKEGNPLKTVKSESPREILLLAKGLARRHPIQISLPEDQTIDPSDGATY